MRERNNRYPYDIIGERIARCRKAAGKSQEDLAKALGLVRTSVTNMEAGVQPVSVEHLLVLSRELFVDPAEIISNIPPRPKPRTEFGPEMKDLLAKLE